MLHHRPHRPSVRPSAAHRNAVHPLRRDSDADEAAGDRIATLNGDSGEVDPGPRGGRDDHSQLLRVRNLVTAGADLDLAFHHGAGPLQPDAIGGGQADGRTGGQNLRARFRPREEILPSGRKQHGCKQCSTQQHYDLTG